MRRLRCGVDDEPPRLAPRINLEADGEMVRVQHSLYPSANDLVSEFPAQSGEGGNVQCSSNISFTV